MRKSDLGESSGVVSDLIFLGVPTIVNDIGVYSSYPIVVVSRIPSSPSAVEIVKEIEDLQDQKTRINNIYSTNNINTKTNTFDGKIKFN